ncbi:hypothetical protein ABH905_002700 [Pseudomonas frederiksbergensis]
MAVRFFLGLIRQAAGEALWRGSLLPLGCEAVVNAANAVCLKHRSEWF